MRELADTIEAQLAAAGTAERAASEKHYLKSDFDFLGTPMPDIRRVMRSVLSSGPTLDHDGVVDLAEALWSRPVFERRMAAVLLLARRADALSERDVPLIERFLRESRTWALVDSLASDVLGALVALAPESMTPQLDRWATDSDFWIRRASLLAELRGARSGDEGALQRFFARAEPMLDVREFFIRKAIGWVLREAARHRPAEVAEWLAPRTHRASGITMREAVKYLPAGDADRLMAAYREHRPTV
jgi:3-methyladenine DNA glycosylase AlkD